MDICLRDRPPNSEGQQGIFRRKRTDLEPPDALEVSFIPDFEEVAEGSSGEKPVGPRVTATGPRRNKGSGPPGCAPSEPPPLACEGSAESGPGAKSGGSMPEKHLPHPPPALCRVNAWRCQRDLQEMLTLPIRAISAGFTDPRTSSGSPFPPAG
ncbi:unnamed protein product [Lepidochelys kempii]